MTTAQDYITHYFNIYPNNKSHAINVIQAIYPDLTKEEIEQLLEIHKNERQER
jgi:hypothetical protein